MLGTVPIWKLIGIQNMGLQEFLVGQLVYQVEVLFYTVEEFAQLSFGALECSVL